jgi:hypothetical protein
MGNLETGIMGDLSDRMSGEDYSPRDCLDRNRYTPNYDTPNYDAEVASEASGEPSRDPIRHKVSRVRLSWLTPGYRGPNCHFDSRTYKDYNDGEKADFDRLLVSIFHHGLKVPLITFQSHVLVGMRRYAIMAGLRHEVVEVWEIVDEDPGMWLGPDIDRLNDLKQRCGDTTY